MTISHHRDPHGSSQLSAKQLGVLNDICDEYERALTGPPVQALPNPTEYLARLENTPYSNDPVMRDALANQLQSIEQDYLRHIGEKETQNLNEAPTNPLGNAESVNSTLQPLYGWMGKYALMEVIGQGGMGTVYRALQTGLDREVAIKVVSIGNSIQNSAKRFESEYHALANLNHENVAKVFDVGHSDLGQTYIAMELIQGENLITLCDREHSSIKQRLKFFRSLCLAVQHAHQKGIIHRDIKPSNVLVATDDQGQKVPKLIDFGLARLVELDRSLTEHGQILGTLHYMSPEQAGFNASEVDTRSDVHSLGIVLFELLTGTTPLGAAMDVRHSGYRAALNHIETVPCPSPSRFLEGMDSQERDMVAAHRSATFVGLRNEIRGDLDAIVVKATQKEILWRYQSVAELIQDISLFLDNKPVNARSVSPIVRLRKAIRRNPVYSLLIFGVILTFVAGTVSTSIGFWLANQRAKQEKIAKEEALASGKRSASVLNLLSSSFTSFSPLRNRTPNVGAMEVLDNALAKLPQLEMDDLGKSVLLQSLSDAYHGLGHYNRAYQCALQSYQLIETQAQVNTDTKTVALCKLATTARSVGKMDDQLSHRIETTLSETQNRLGHFHDLSLLVRQTLIDTWYSQGRKSQGRSLADSEYQKILSELTLDDSKAIWMIKAMIRSKSRSEEPIDFEDSIKMYERHKPQILESFQNAPVDEWLFFGELGIAMWKVRRFHESVVFYERSIQAAKRTVGEERDELVVGFVELARSQLRAGDIVAAQKTLDETCDRYQLQGKRDLAHFLALTLKSQLAFAKGNHEQTKEIVQQLFLELKAVNKLRPEDCWYVAVDLARELLLECQQPELTRAFLQACERDLADRLPEQHPIRQQASEYLGAAYAALGRERDGIPLLRKRIQLIETSANGITPASLVARRNLVAALILTRDSEAAWTEFQSMLDLIEALMSDPTVRAREWNFGNIPHDCLYLTSLSLFCEEYELTGRMLMRFEKRIDVGSPDWTTFVEINWIVQLEQNRWQEAMELVSKVQTSPPWSDDPAKQAILLATLAECAAIREDWEEAMKLCQQVGELPTASLSDQGRTKSVMALARVHIRQDSEPDRTLDAELLSHAEAEAKQAMEALAALPRDQYLEAGSFASRARERHDRIRRKATEHRRAGRRLETRGRREEPDVT